MSDEMTEKPKYNKPFGFLKITNCPLTYGFIGGQTKMKFFNVQTGKLIELEELHLELVNLTETERSAFWDYVIRNDMYLRLLSDSRIKYLPMNVRQHVSHTYKL